MRVRIQIPEPIIFSVSIPVRIGDINYGGHVGNDSILSIVHEARMAFFARAGCSEMNAGGVNLIMADSAIQYKGESFYGDIIQVSISVGQMTSISFDMYYTLTTQRAGSIHTIAWVKTGMICFDYSSRKIVSMTSELEKILRTSYM